MLCPEQILKTIVVVVMLAGIIPLLLSWLVKLVIEVPLRVPVDETPFNAWQVGNVCKNCKSCVWIFIIRFFFLCQKS